MNEQLISNLWYTISAITDCDVETHNGVTIHLPAGIQYFHFADANSIYISGQYKLTQNPPLFKPASASALGGGFIESNLNVGHGASAAVAAVCTLTLGDLATGGTLADSNGQSVELEAPHKYAEGGASFRDAAEACTLTIGEWSMTWEAAPGTRATGWLQLEAGMGTFMVNGLIVSNPEDYTDVEAWNDVLEPCGVYCTDESIESGSPKVNIAAIEYGEAGNAITLEAVGEFYSVSGPTLAGGANGRTARDVFNDIHDDDDCPVDVTLDADELGLGFTAKEYGVNDAISAEGDMFSNWSGMSGGHGDYSVAELITAISGEFDDITPTAGEAEGTIVLTANTAGAAANSITYTATGCFGSGTVKQGSITRGRNAVAQTDYEVILNGNQLRQLEEDTAMRNGGVYTVAAAGAALDFSGVTLGLYATAQIWLDYNDVTNITFPPSWVWLTENGAVPVFDFFKRYKLEVSDDGLKTTARLLAEYAYFKEFVYPPLTKDAYTEGAPLNVLVDFTSVDGGGGAKPYHWYAFSTENYTSWPFNKTADGEYSVACELSRPVALKAVIPNIKAFSATMGIGTKFHIACFDEETEQWRQASEEYEMPGNSWTPFVIPVTETEAHARWRVNFEGGMVNIRLVRLFER